MAQKEKYHPLVRVINQYVKKRHLFGTGAKIVVGVSGGVDSMVLLHYLAEVRQQFRLRITVAHVNYRLRGAASDADERLVKKTAARFGFPFRSRRIDLKKNRKRGNGSLQESAREIRYSFFESVRNSAGADVVMTAHHADDNAETMLFHFLRGTGLEGLAGIPARRETIVRPMLCLTRRMIEDFAKEQRIVSREDATNSSDDYSRNFLRNTIIPHLRRRINPSLTTVLSQESELFRSAADFAELETEKLYGRLVQQSSILLKEWKTVHPFLQWSVIRRLLKERSIDPVYSGVAAVAALAEQQKGSIVELSGTVAAERLSDRIVIRPRAASDPFRCVIDGEGTYSAGRVVLTVKKSRLPLRTGNKRSAGASIEYVDADRLQFPLVLRSWNPGDRFIPLGMTGSKKLSDFFSEQKMSASEKQETPIVESGGSIVWVAGRRLDDRFKMTKETTSIYQLTMRTNGKKNDHRQ